MKTTRTRGIYHPAPTSGSERASDQRAPCARIAAIVAA
jgi:hypothetical protein